MTYWANRADYQQAGNIQCVCKSDEFETKGGSKLGGGDQRRSDWFKEATSEGLVPALTDVESKQVGRWRDRR